MARQRFVESYIIDPISISRVESTPELRERVKEAYSKITSNKLTEETFYLPESKTIWEVPISRVDIKNANGRIYPRALWERILSSQKHLWEGSPMLSDHPDGDKDGSTKDIVGVWLGARMDESGTVWGTLVFTKNGENLEEAVNLGLKLGTSSSGYGDLLRDGVTVDPDSYEIERLSDAVLNPSQGTYLNVTNKLKKDNTKIEQSSKDGFEIKREFMESISDKNRTAASAPTQEKQTMTKFSKIEERKIRSEIDSFLRETESKKDPQVRLEEMSDILSFINENEYPEDLKVKVQEKITAEQKNIKNLLSEAAKLKEEFQVQNTEKLKEGVAFLAEEVKIIEDEAKDYQKIAEALLQNNKSLKATLSARPTSKYVESLIKKMNKLTADTNQALREKDQKISSYREALKEKVELIEAMESEVAEKEEDMEKKEESISNLKKTISSLREKVSSFRTQIQEQDETHKEQLREMEERTNPVSRMIPKASDRLGKYLKLDETNEVEQYWKSLVERHGRDIKPFEEKIKSVKTLREAKDNYMDAIGAMTTPDMIPFTESNAMTRDERKIALKESGMRFEESTDVVSKALSKLGFI